MKPPAGRALPRDRPTAARLPPAAPTARLRWACGVALGERKAAKTMERGGAILARGVELDASMLPVAVGSLMLPSCARLLRCGAAGCGEEAGGVSSEGQRR